MGVLGFLFSLAGSCSSAIAIHRTYRPASALAPALAAVCLLGLGLILLVGARG